MPRKRTDNCPSSPYIQYPILLKNRVLQKFAIYVCFETRELNFYTTIIESLAALTNK